MDGMTIVSVVLLSLALVAAVWSSVRGSGPPQWGIAGMCAALIAAQVAAALDAPTVIPGLLTIIAVCAILYQLRVRYRASRSTPPAKSP